MPDFSLRRRFPRSSHSSAALSRLAGRRMSAVVLALAVTALSLVSAPSASAAPATHAVPRTKATSPTAPGQHPTSRVCRTPGRAGEMSCLSMVRDDVAAPKGVRPADTPAGFGPADLLAAYDLPAAGSSETVAIVDAFDNPNAEADLGIYRQQYGLPACTTANGCFKKIDQRGGTSYPPPDAGWAGEIALDIDMVSAVCPTCKILLVESDDNFMDNLGTAVNQAVAQGAKFVSNSYGGGEGSDEGQADDAYFHHPGVAVTASSGDDGYGASYPAASPYVTSVGGTSLVKDTSSARGWSESTWDGAGSGCSAYEAKPSFQHDTGCARRTIADVSAVADPNTGVAVYNGGWHVYGGTSVSAPIIASVYALGGAPATGSEPNSFPYDHPSDLNDVTSGNNGTCSPAYLCTAGDGYDGPTGLGTPNGVGAFRSGPHGMISGTVTDGSAPLASAQVKAGDVTATTDGQGHYALSVPPGTYDVSASKFGYAAKTVAGVEVGDGQTITENLALAAKARVDVSGLVRDGSGHGWPLYATVRVKDEPTAVAYTDPKTGRYTLSLPADDTYTLQVDPLYPGYTQDSHDVTVTAADTVHDVNAAVDQTTCSAPGYGYHYAGDTQPFDGTTAPSGWTVDDTAGNGQTWVFDDPGARGNKTGGTGGFAIIDSDHYGSGNTQDSSLISPVTDFSARTHPILTFRTDWYGYTGQAGDLDLSVDGGTTWSNLKHYTASLRGPRTEAVDLSAAAGKSAVRVRFHFTGKFGYYWQVDDAFLGDRTCDPTSGGLVVGQVKDANTGAGVNGATVTSADRPAEQATSAATPDDPNLGDGFSWMFSSVTSSHKFTATAGNYGSADATVNVAANWATAADFALSAPRITVTPGAISKTVGWQKAATAALTLKNTGTSPVTAKLGEQPGGGQPAAKGAPLQRVKGDFASGRLRHGKAAAAKAGVTPYAPPWTAIADYASPVMDNGAAALNGKIYSVAGVDGTNLLDKAYAYDPATQAWTAIASLNTAREAPQATATGGKLYVTGGWGDSGDPVPATEIFDPSSGAWSAGADNPKPYAGSGAAALGGKIYVVGGCTAACGTKDVQVYDPSADSWSSGPAYPENTAWLGCAGIDGKLYCAGGSASASTKHGYVLDPASGTWAPIADLPIDLWAMGYSSANGKLIVSGGVTDGTSTLTNQGFAYSPETNSWTALPNSNNSLYRGASACGLYKIGGSLGQFNAVKSGEVLPGYDQCASTADVPWLSENPAEVTIQPGKSVKVTVTVDANVAAITQPGTYTAQITIGAKTPYAITPVDVTMTVNPPNTWGKVTGTLTGAGCTGAPGALAGATLQIDSWAASYTLKTDKDGRYALWLDVRNNPLSLIAAKDGWAPQTRTVKITKLASTTADFTLKPDHTCS
ncbi:MAG: carboxypeptidase regulatory-like domain-containing protein [Actinoallomurus sp.]